MPVSPVDEIASNCLALRLRLIHRRVNALYDEALRPYGIRIGQLNLLVAIALMEPATASALAKQLHIDRSTLSRDLERLVENGWVGSTPDVDRRSQILTLTETGARTIADALPAWRIAQQRADELLGSASQPLVNSANALFYR